MPFAPKTGCRQPGCSNLTNAQYCREHAQRVAVTLVCGPPGAGKTSHVKQRAARGDLVVDVDTLYSALSGLQLYQNPDNLLPFVAAARNAVLLRLYRDSDVHRAWIITSSGATRKERHMGLAGLRGETIVLATEPEECLRRIEADPKRAGANADWQKLIREWWARYQPDSDH